MIIINTTPARKAPQFLSMTEDFAHSGGPSYSWTHVIEPQAKVLLIPQISVWYWGLYGIGASVGGVALSSLYYTSYNYSGLNYATFCLWGIVNPPTGSQTITVSCSSLNNYGSTNALSLTYDKCTAFGTGGITGSQSYSVTGGDNVTVANAFMKLGSGYSGGEFINFLPHQIYVSGPSYAVGDGEPGAAEPTFGFTATAGVSSCYGAYVPLIGEP